jgi:hypothetical protein
MPFQAFIDDDDEDNVKIELVWASSDGATITRLAPENPVGFFDRDALHHKRALSPGANSHICVSWCSYIVGMTVYAAGSGTVGSLTTAVHGEAEYNSFIAAFTKLVEYCEKK